MRYVDVFICLSRWLNISVGTYRYFFYINLPKPKWISRRMIIIKQHVIILSILLNIIVLTRNTFLRNFRKINTLNYREVHCVKWTIIFQKPLIVIKTIDNLFLLQTFSSHPYFKRFISFKCMQSAAYNSGLQIVCFRWRHQMYWHDSNLKGWR